MCDKSNMIGVISCYIIPLYTHCVCIPYMHTGCKDVNYSPIASPSFHDIALMYDSIPIVHLYIQICVHTCTYIYIYICIYNTHIYSYIYIIYAYIYIVCVYIYSMYIYIYKIEIINHTTYNL